MDIYRPIYIDNKNTNTSTIIKIKELYNKNYIIKFFRVGNLVNFRLYNRYYILGIKSNKIKF